MIQFVNSILLRVEDAVIDLFYNMDDNESFRTDKHRPEFRRTLSWVFPMILSFVFQSSISKFLWNRYPNAVEYRPYEAAAPQPSFLSRMVSKITGRGN